jgi:hypothetical protein
MLTFDMLDGDFSHDGDDCTFETLIRASGFKTKPPRRSQKWSTMLISMTTNFSGTNALGSIAFLKVRRSKA